MSTTNVIYDCDPGHDDALALFMLLANENVNVKALTTSAGNQTQDKTSANLRSLLTLAGIDSIPIGRGAEHPLRRDLIIADNIHGKSGIDGATLPDGSDYPISGSALEVMSRTLEAADEPITIVASGPLTNVAILLLARPDLKDKIAAIHFMGGAIFGGNWSSTAEFNIFVDPEAADIVVNSGCDIYMYGLDVTLKAQLFAEDIEQIREIGGAVPAVMADLLAFFNTRVAQPFLAPEGHVEGLHLHDPCAAAGVISPEIFVRVPLHVEVDRREGPTLGMTIGDYKKRNGKDPNVSVAFDIDNAKMRDLVFATMRKLA